MSKLKERKLTFIQHNVNHSSPAHNAILQQAFELNTNVLLIQEPYVAQDRLQGDFICISHPSFYTVSPTPMPALNRVRERPRTLTYIRKSPHLQFSPRYDLCKDPDMQVIELIIEPEEFFIINIYNEKQRPQSNLHPSLLTQDYTIDRLLLPLKLDTPVILAGDFNLHHPRWNAAANSSKISKAQPFVNWLDQHKAETLVDAEEINERGGTLLRSNLKSTSVIDLTFSLGFQQICWENWRFLPPTGSDHEAITFEASLSHHTSPGLLNNPTLPPCFNHKKADWDKFKQAIQQGAKRLTIPEITNSDQMDKIAQLFTDTVTQAAEFTIPRARPCERSKPWWTKELNTLRKSLHSALRVFKRTRSEADSIV